jgi:hypothetical protein
MARVILQNNHWNQVTIQVRKGDNADPMQNMEWGQFTLTRTDNVRIIPTTQNIQFRREMQPGSNNGQFSNWQNVAVFPNSQDLPREIL